MTPREKIDQEVYLLVRGRLGDRASEEDVAMLTDLTCSAIDAATKPLRAEIELLRAEVDRLRSLSGVS